MDTLKPCPFCGGEARYLTAYDMNCEPYRMNYIACKTCKIRTANESRHPDDGRSQELIKAWNTRIGKDNENK